MGAITVTRGKGIKNGGAVGAQFQRLQMYRVDQITYYYSKGENGK